MKEAESNGLGWLRNKIGASILMLTACGPDMTREQVIDYGERDTFIITGTGVIVETGSDSADDSFTKGFRIHKDKLKEVTGGWDRSLMPIELERFCELAKPEPLSGGYSEVRENRY